MTAGLFEYSVGQGAETNVSLLCGTAAAQVKPYSQKSMLLALFLCWILGTAGVHRFYVGKNATGVLWLFTGGLFGIGYITDYILIACGRFTDKKGFVLKL